MILKRSIQFLAVMALLESFGNAQTSKRTPTSEQSKFAVEGIEIAKPVRIPEAVVKILREDKYVRGCLRQDQPSTEIPASWFVGSKIHLNESDETDLIVLPRQLSAQDNSPSENACLYGANVAPFWVFRKMPGGYVLVLGISALGLKVLSTKSNGYRDISTWSSTAVTQTTLFFRFDGHKYRLSTKKASDE